MENVLRAALYERVSHEEQVKFGYSIRAQKDTLEEHCKEKGYKIVGHYTDEGISGAKPPLKRPALKQLLNDVKAGKIDIIIFTKLDRWFRSVEQYYKVQEILEKCNVSWQAVLEDYNTATADGRLKVNIMLSIAANERDRTSERIKVVFVDKIKNGEVITGAVPMGYMIQQDNDGKKRLVKDPAMRHIVEEYWEILVKYNSLRKAVTYLNDKYGLNFTYAKWSNMRKNELYTGEYRGVKDYCEPYLSRKDWLKAQSGQIKKAQKNRIYLFTGLLRCSGCGGTLCCNTTTRKRLSGSYEYRSYRCNRGYTHTCPNRALLPEVKIERYLLDNLQQLIEEELKAVEALKIEKIEIEKANPKPKPKTEIAKLKEQMRKLNNVYMTGTIDDEEYFARSAELKSLLEQASKETPEEERDITHLEELLKTDWKALYNLMDLENKRRFWRGIIKAIPVDGKTIKKPIFI